MAISKFVPDAFRKKRVWGGSSNHFCSSKGHYNFRFSIEWALFEVYTNTPSIWRASGKKIKHWSHMALTIGNAIALPLIIHGLDIVLSILILVKLINSLSKTKRYAVLNFCSTVICKPKKIMALSFFFFFLFQCHCITLHKNNYDPYWPFS